MYFNVWLLVFIISFITLNCSPYVTIRDIQAADKQSNATTVAKTLLDSVSNSRTPWTKIPTKYWTRFPDHSQNDGMIKIPEADIEAEKIGRKTRVHQLYNRWQLNNSICYGRSHHYAEITAECKGKIDLNFALTQEAWDKPLNRLHYYRAVNTLITRIGNELLVDFGELLEDTERDLFLRAVKTLAWQESKWQHYFRYKDWFFVLVSATSYNKLSDWGITQVARSSFEPTHLLNKIFFDDQGYCSISSSLYYGFMEYYFCYLEARKNPDNRGSLFNKIIGAYNRYCSGYSASFFGLSKENEKFKNYQVRAMGAFTDAFIQQPWQDYLQIRPRNENYSLHHGGVSRGDTTTKEIALIFTGGDYADGGNTIGNTLEKHDLTASFFFTGDFYRNDTFQPLIERLIADGHYLGPHSDKHLLYCAWENRDSTLVSEQQFGDDLRANYQAMEQFGIKKEDVLYFIPPYEWYNADIAAWSKKLDLILCNFTPGTSSNADYTTPDMQNYLSSQAILKKIQRYERKDPNGLNGFLLLIHIGTHPNRTDKFYNHLDQLISKLLNKGYRFKRIDALLK